MKKFEVEYVRVINVNRGTFVAEVEAEDAQAAIQAVHERKVDGYPKPHTPFGGEMDVRHIMRVEEKKT